MAVRKKAQKHLTPAGIAQYPRLTKPDTAFGNIDGIYKVTLVLPGAEAQGLVSLIDAAMAESLKKARMENPTKAKAIKAATDKPYKAVTDDNGNETGEVKFNFKMKAKITSKTGESWQQRPDIFDAKGKVLLDPKIGGGSKIKVAFEIYPFWTQLIGAGVSLRLLAVQVLDLVEYNARNASAYGFGEEEGYVAGEQTDNMPASEAPDRAVDPAQVEAEEADEVPF